MGWVRNLWYWLLANDPALNADQRLQRWVNVAAAVGVVVSAGGGVIGWVFSNPWIGVVIGLVVWVVLLNSLVAFKRAQPDVLQRDRRASTPTDSGRIYVKRWQDLERENEVLKAKLRESEQEREGLRAGGDTRECLRTGNEGLEVEIERLKEYETRWLLKLALKDAYEAGSRLQKADPDAGEVSEWVSRLYQLIKEALPKFYVEAFDEKMRRKGLKVSTSEGPREFRIDVKGALDGGLKGLESLMRLVDSRKCPNLLPEFNGREWVSER